MRKTFEPLDDVLIEWVFQPLSDSISYRTGLARGVAACLCLDLASLSWIVSRAPGLSDDVVAWEAGSAFLDICLVLLGLAAMISLRTLFRRTGAKVQNPLRSAMRPHRAIALVMLVAQLVRLQPRLADSADAAMLLFAALALYFGACAERPPARRTSAAFVPAG
ncbi:MAG TPA: hypothetical protein VGC09_18890 [Rhodopila sp.]